MYRDLDCVSNKKIRKGMSKYLDKCWHKQEKFFCRKVTVAR